MNPGIIVNVLYQLIGFYGNWGGKGWSGGTHDPDNIDWSKDGADPLDRTFKTHDSAYYEAEEAFKNGEIDKSTYDSQKYQADKQLLEDMGSIDTHYYADAKKMRP